MTKDNHLKVEAIKNGTVIDHIPANVGFKVLKLFKLDDTAERVTIGLNLPSSALGKKDLIKIENVLFDEQRAKRLALLAPNATVNKIENYQVVAKLPVVLPEYIKGVFGCANTNCITHVEPAVESHFGVFVKDGDIQLKCKYCEKVFSREVMTEQA
ncbi:aspartate carbamoyltransferase regulatory subunit [Shewanella submarina]|uniref:Aspartate carbamoyltransferase regulatory chain n=1 Tax=Shewanella submarina TaxID=2016376 RepID=A0ABV7G8X7_9GAMM|nr:aspartate carbamoyltransferase regulatory subunit [Shewanella submarina]MCL1036671.1 aspartate carbamoyltransferase regulatory subunit [Shewanella submarina]